MIGVVDPSAGTVERVTVGAGADVERVGVAVSIGTALVRSGEFDKLDDVELLAPIPRPARNVFCIGKNYRAHAAEIGRSGYDATGGGEVPDRLVVFSKPPSTVIGHGATIERHASVTNALDYEAELAVIIGRGGRSIAAERAYEHVWAYTVINDVTARDLQRDHRQWLLGKGLDTFCPMGPWVVTADELDLSTAEVSASVNGELRQKARVEDLVVDVPTVIEILSRGITLEPGDIIATGTPAGVGVGFTPPRFLRAGDVVAVSVSGIGTLVNTIGDR